MLERWQPYRSIPNRRTYSYSQEGAITGGAIQWAYSMSLMGGLINEMGLLTGAYSIRKIAFQ